jgi:hypothetical protein
MEAYKELFLKYLNQLKEEIGSFPDEDSLWRLAGDIKNTPGNLCLHICGNLKHNFGAVLGNAGYKRDRDAEFSRKNVPKDALLREVDNTIEMITPVIDNLTDEDMKKIFPSDPYSQGGTSGLVMTRIGMHLGYHLGQINYHRRLISEVRRKK